MVLLGTLMSVRDTTGPVMVMRYNMYSAAAITGNTTPGTSSGQAVALHGGDRQQGTAAVDGLRLDRTDLHATASRQHGDVCLRAGGGVCLSGAGGPVRKLETAAGRHPGRADVLALLPRGRGMARHGREHLHADRFRRAGRPGQQERHPDRRVRQAAAARPACRGARRRWKPAGCDCGRS